MPPGEPPVPHPLHTFRNALLAGVAASLLMALIFGVTLWRERAEALAHARQQAGNLALVAQRDLQRTFELCGLSLQAMIDGWLQEEVMSLRPPIRRQVLFDRSIDATNISSAALIDSDGRVIEDLNHPDAIGRDLSDRAYFQSHRKMADDGMHLSVPFVSRVDGIVNIALTRRLSRQDGSFGGVAVLYLNAAYFRQLLEGLDIGPNGRTTVFGPQGTVHMTLPYAPEMVGEEQGGTALYQAMAAERNGSFVAPATAHAPERLVAFRTVTGPELKVMVAPALPDIYAAWFMRVVPVSLAVFCFGLGLIAVSGLLGRELQARRRAEGRLEMLANTDGLTGLVNRRALEAILAAEGRRARREASGVAVLFADVDHFKHYNDSQGHPAGDAVLAAVARVLRACIQRPGDHVGRYGGEEFLAVLAQTGVRGAYEVAERIRHAVEALALPHPASPFGVVTVSIGIAATAQDDFGDMQALVSAADTALYRAKTSGRNRVGEYVPQTDLPPIESGYY